MHYVHFVTLLFSMILIENQSEGRYISYASSDDLVANADPCSSNPRVATKLPTADTLSKNINKEGDTDKVNEIKADLNQDTDKKTAEGVALRCNTDNSKGSANAAPKCLDDHAKDPWNHGVRTNQEDIIDGYYCPGKSTWLPQEALIKTSDPKSNANKWIGGDLLAEKCKTNNEYNCLKIQFEGETGIASVDGWKICGGNSGKCEGRISQYMVLYRNPTTDQWATFQEKGCSGTPQTFSVDEKGVATELQDKPVIAQELMFCPLEAVGSTPLLHVTVKGCLLKKSYSSNTAVAFPPKADDGMCISEEVWLDMDDQLKACMFHTNAGGRASDAIFSRAGYSFPNIPLKVEQNDKYYLEVSFPVLKAIKAIKVMGGSIGDIQGTIERFKLSYKDVFNNGAWVFVHEENKCNTDKVLGQRQPSNYASGYYKANRIPLRPPIITNGIRLYPQTWCGDRPVTRVDFKACDIIPRKKTCEDEDEKEPPCTVQLESLLKSFQNSGITKPCRRDQVYGDEANNEIRYIVGKRDTGSKEMPSKTEASYNLYPGDNDGKDLFKLEDESHNYLDETGQSQLDVIEKKTGKEDYSKFSKREVAYNNPSFQHEEKEASDLVNRYLPDSRHDKGTRVHAPNIVKREEIEDKPFLRDQEEANYYLDLSHFQGKERENEDLAKLINVKNEAPVEDDESEASDDIDESQLQETNKFILQENKRRYEGLPEQDTAEDESQLADDVAFVSSSGDDIDELGKIRPRHQMNSLTSCRGDVNNKEDRELIDDKPTPDEQQANYDDQRPLHESSNIYRNGIDDTDMNIEREAPDFSNSQYKKDADEYEANDMLETSNINENKNDKSYNTNKREIIDEPKLEQEDVNYSGKLINVIENQKGDSKITKRDGENQPSSEENDDEANNIDEISNINENGNDDSKINKLEVFNENKSHLDDTTGEENERDNVRNENEKDSSIPKQEVTNNELTLEGDIKDENEIDMSSNIYESENDASDKVSKREVQDKSTWKDQVAGEPDGGESLNPDKNENDNSDNRYNREVTENESSIEDQDEESNAINQLSSINACEKDISEVNNKQELTAIESTQENEDVEENEGDEAGYIINENDPNESKLNDGEVGTSDSTLEGKVAGTSENEYENDDLQINEREVIENESPLEDENVAPISSEESSRIHANRKDASKKIYKRDVNNNKADLNNADAEENQKSQLDEGKISGEDNNVLVVKREVAGRTKINGKQRSQNGRLSEQPTTDVATRSAATGFPDVVKNQGSSRITEMEGDSLRGERSMENSNAQNGGTDDLIIIPMKYARATDLRNLMNEIKEALLKSNA